MFRNHYSQVMLMYKLPWLRAYSADFAGRTLYTALVARQKAATSQGHCEAYSVAAGLSVLAETVG